MANSKELQILINAKDNTAAAFKSVSSKLDEAKRASDAFALALGGAVAAVSVFGLKTAADFETTEIGMKTLLGSAEEARSTMQKIKEEAKRTPFELPGLSKAVMLMASVTEDGDKAVKVVMDVGEALAAMGKGQVEMDRVAVNLQQIAAVGKAATVDIKQFAFAGIPIYKMLQEETGKTGDALSEFIEEGGVSFELIAQMFDKANDAGGRFFNAYVNQAGSLTQSWSNLKDTITIAGAEFVNQIGLFDMAKVVTQNLTAVLGNLSGQIKVVIDYFRENEKATFMFAGAILGALVPAIWGMITAFAAAAIALAPFVIGGAIIGGLIYGFMQFTNGADSLTGRLKLLIDFIDQKTGLITIFKTAFDNVVLVFKMHLLPTLQNLWDKLQPLMPIFSLLAEIIGLTLYGALILVVKVIEVSLIVGMTTLEWILDKANKTLEFFGDTWHWITDKLKDAYTWIKKLIDKVQELNVVQGAKNFISDKFGFGGGKAIGGPVSGGTTYLVGEKGPELFRPNVSGSIVPNNKLGGGGSVININISGNTLLDARAAEKMGDLIIQRLGMNKKLCT
jgi:tape measure domain-containing protein